MYSNIDNNHQVKNQQLSLLGDKPMSVDMTRTRFMHRIADLPATAEGLTAPPRIFQQLSSTTSGYSC